MTDISAVNTRNLPVLAKGMAEKTLGQTDFLRLMTTQLLRFQQAYEAAARTIQVARETMQTMLNIF